MESQNENPAEGTHSLDASGKIISQQGTGGIYIVKEMEQISVLDDEEKKSSPEVELGPSGDL